MFETGRKIAGRKIRPPDCVAERSHLSGFWFVYQCHYGCYYSTVRLPTGRAVTSSFTASAAAAAAAAADAVDQAAA